MTPHRVTRIEAFEHAESGLHTSVVLMHCVVSETVALEKAGEPLLLALSIDES